MTIAPTKGDTSLATGLFTIYVENRSRYDGAFILVKMDARATRADVEAFPKKLRQRLKRGNLAPVRPPFTSVVPTHVSYGLVSELPVNVSAGKYGLVCLQEPMHHAPPTAPSHDPPRALYLATLLEVSEKSP